MLLANKLARAVSRLTADFTCGFRRGSSLPLLPLWFRRSLGSCTPCHTNFQPAVIGLRTCQHYNITEGTKSKGSKSLPAWVAFPDFGVVFGLGCCCCCSARRCLLRGEGATAGAAASAFAAAPTSLNPSAPPLATVFNRSRGQQHISRRGRLQRLHQTMPAARAPGFT